MSTLYVCALIDMPRLVQRVRPSHLVSAITADTMPETPDGFASERHLRLALNDITEPRDGLAHPTEDHIAELLTFVRTWRRDAPLVVHCLAGVSRSTAAAFITLCAHHEPGVEKRIAKALRDASPTATPNALMVQIADDLLDRKGRMVDAVAAIGTGEFGFATRPFALPVRF